MVDIADQVMRQAGIGKNTRAGDGPGRGREQRDFDEGED